MALEYPAPELDVTLQEVSRVLQLTLNPDRYADFKSTLEKQRPLLEEAQQKIASSSAGQENWGTEHFKKSLLSCADPLSTASALPVVLLPSKAKGCNQLMRAAALLWATAKLHSEPEMLDDDVALERTQQSEVFAATRIPGKSQDEIKVYPESIHAIITCVGGVFPIDILQRSSTSEPLSPRSFTDIYNQLAKIAEQLATGSQNDPLDICRLSALDRRSWAAIRDEIVEKGGPAAASLQIMESAVVVLSLEDCNAPSELGDVLNAVSLGGGNGPCLRYYDKVVNLAVFKDCTAGMIFEHCTVDGMVVGLITDRIHHLSETVDLSLIHKNAAKENGFAKMNDTDPLHSVPLKFGLNSKESTKLCPELKSKNPLLSFDLPSYPDAFSALRSQRGLYGVWINFSLQLSLMQTLGESAATHMLITPTHMRHYKHGRCDPTYSVSVKSRKLVDALASSLRPDNTIQYTNGLLNLFHVAYLQYKTLIKNTKSGQGVGPHLALLRKALPSDNQLKKFLDPFGCPSVYLTGLDLMEGVECAVGNVYAQDQLAVTYLGKKDKVRVILNGKGSFSLVLEKLQENLKKNMKLVMLLALRYAIACQMGALDILLKENQTKNVNVEMTHAPLNDNNKTTPDSTADVGSDYTLVIHGGAGEGMMLDPEVTDVIEFALQTALALGSQVLQSGGQSLDAVQRSVEALEDCFLFNAGKGSVFNREGKNEMEAAIVDGSQLKSGAVACVQSVKNPIKAARSVMEKSIHSLLMGEGAEEFLQGLEEQPKPVKPDYFYTDLRNAELAAKLRIVKPAKNNHPQTVGAVAWDCHRRLAAASSTGGLVGKLKGRVGDTAVVGAGIYADKTLAISCSGDGDVFLRHTVAQKIASLYHLKGRSLRNACREVITENLKDVCAGVIAVDSKGNVVIETNAGVMFVASNAGGRSRVEVLRPLKNVSNVIWEKDELVAYLNPNPWTPGSTVLTRKTLSGVQSVFHLAESDYVSLFQEAKSLSGTLCGKLGVQRCALVFYPNPKQSAQIRLLPLHGVGPKWQPHLASQEEFCSYSPGYYSSKSGPRWDDAALDKVQAQIRKASPTANAPPSFEYFGASSDDNLFSRIVRGEEQQWRVWEDSQHVAFLTPYPNTPGITVVVPRKPLPSDIFKLSDDDYKALISATYKVAQLLEEGLGTQYVALIFEGYQINYAHTKLVPVLPFTEGLKMATPQPEFFLKYPGYVSSLDGPAADPDELKTLHSKITQCQAPKSWEDPESHSIVAITSQWYRSVFQIQNTLFHSTVEYFSNSCQYSYALTPLTTDAISSPMGLGSDSEPVSVNLLGQNIYLADSMQFVLEYFLRFQDNLQGTYYISPSFRGEDPDATHLNQFYHVECELLGDIDCAISVAEGYLHHLTKSMLKRHSDLILSIAGTLTHVTMILNKLDGKKPLPRVSLDQAIPMMPSDDCFEWVQDGQPQFGRKLTRKGERVLIEKYGGFVWLTEMDHLGVPFYQAYVEGSGQSKAKAADLLLGLGETLGLGERHPTSSLVQEALRHHAVPHQPYKWYTDMREVKPLLTSGWGMGTERYLCWLLQHNDVRDIQIIPRLKGKKYMP
ncbi:uncharacterized protein si:ch211-256m1.8 isoform X2 [Syngnathoides biaculeatus]|nr:uncharacterized protein si:ch211-256m1.8 isoform X2 [Syngnathoides biaculeatus]